MTRDTRHLVTKTAATLAVLMGSVAVAAQAQKDAPVKAAQEPASAKAWLGCRIGPVPSAVDKQLGLGGKGAIILNVAVDSPADKVGLERYDVVVAVDDKTVASPDALIRSIAKRSPKTVVDLSVMRKGELMKMKVTLAAPPAPGSETYKHDELPDAYVDDRMGVRGHILKKGPKGWEVEDLGELDDKLDLDGLLAPGKRHGRLWFDRDDDKVVKFHARVSGEGKTIEVVGDESGKITVTRRPGKDGADVSMVTYDDPAKLKAEDPEAYDIYREAVAGHKRPRHPLADRPKLRHPSYKDLFERYRDRLKAYGHRALERVPDFELGDLPNLTERELREMNRRLAELNRKLADQWQKRDQLWQRVDPDKYQKMMEEFRAELERALKDAVKRLPSQPGPAAVAPGEVSEPLRFEVDLDGKVTVHITKPEGSVTLEFRDLAALKEKRPDLFSRYKELEKP